MAVKLNLESRMLIAQFAEARYPNEACGLILKVGRKSVAVECENVAEDKGSRFRISPVDYARHAKSGKVVAIWHSHIDQPSEASIADIEMCRKCGIPWYIASVYQGKFHDVSFISPDDKEIPYLARPYVLGIHDCYSLLTDFYQREFGIFLRTDRERIPEFWSLKLDIFTEGYSEEGFIDVHGEPKFGDVFLIQSMSDVPNHIAIYIGDEKIIHHPHGRLSSTDIYGGYWERHTVRHLRHEQNAD